MRGTVSVGERCLQQNQGEFPCFGVSFDSGVTVRSDLSVLPNAHAIHPTLGEKKEFKSKQAFFRLPPRATLSVCLWILASDGSYEKLQRLTYARVFAVAISCCCGEKVLNLNLNPVVWKTILSRKVALSDLDLVDATYYK